MSEKWNGLMLSGGAANETASEIVQRARGQDATAAQIMTPEGNTFVWISGYNLPGSGEPTRFWLLDQVKKQSCGVEWGVATHGNTTEDTGRAWVLRNHDGYMDVIDIVLGHQALHGRDVERYLEDTHGVTVPVWTPSNPGSDAVSVSEISESVIPIPDSQIEQARSNYPYFDRIGTLADPVEVTRPNRQRPTAGPMDEERSVTLTGDGYKFIISSIEEYTDYDVTEVEAQFEMQYTFVGTWNEFTTLFWKKLDAVLAGLYHESVEQAEANEIRLEANQLKWQAAIDWHRDTEL